MSLKVRCLNLQIRIASAKLGGVSTKETITATHKSGAIRRLYEPFDRMSYLRINTEKKSPENNKTDEGNKESKDGDIPQRR